MHTYYLKQKTFSDRFFHACLASMNAGAAMSLASMALGYYNTEICVNFNATSRPRHGTTFCLPSDYLKKYFQTLNLSSPELLGGFSHSLLDFSAGVAGILSIHAANEAYRHFKEVF